MEGLLYYQTMICEMTQMECANASLLDEGSAASEAMYMSYNAHNGKKNKFFIDKHTFPQTISVVKTRADALNIELVIDDVMNHDWNIEKDVCGVLLQNPNDIGTCHNYSDVISKIHTNGAKAIIAADLMSLALVKSPGEMGADIALGKD